MRSVWKALAAVFVAAAVAELFVVAFNYAVWFRLTKRLPFEVRGRVSAFVPGQLAVRNVGVRYRDTFESFSPEVRVSYGLWDLMRSGKLRLEAHSEKNTLTLGGLAVSTGFSELELEPVRVSLSIEADSSVEVRYFYAKSGDLVLFSAGRVKQGQIDLDLSCFLTERLVAKLPPFVTQNLFLEQGLPLRQIRLRALGDWDHPSVTVSSDLINLEVKSRAPAAA
ncbi:MAG: hypothetical protein HY714_03200 [Candidatus Omnitrophica bacterium]|nr:hypothetical protein [Candidatus Omnitrophota bacterium]